MKKTVSIIGGGPSALLLAAFLDQKKFSIHIYEQKKAIGRKLLVAGKGGFNLTHAKHIKELIQEYTPPSFLKKALLNFDNEKLREWLKEIGVPTYVGSSNRVYPQQGIKPIEVVQRMISDLETKGVNIHYQHKWIGWNQEDALTFESGATIQSDYTVFALGGASWRITGSDGSWTTAFKEKDIQLLPFEASNCAFQIKWPKSFVKTHGGAPLKNIALSCRDKTQKGELVITEFGLEGNAIYALSPQIRAALKEQQSANIHLDLKPRLSTEKVLEKLEQSKEKTTSNKLKQALKLGSAQLELLKLNTSKAVFTDHKLLAKAIKKLTINITGIAPIDEAISTVGGVCLSEVSQHFELKKMARHFCIGEMLDWDAPTGGYLLQANFSMGVYLAQYLSNLD